MQTLTTKAMAEEFDLWTASHNLPSMSAEELLVCDLTPAQRTWLREFTERWDGVQRAEDEGRLTCSLALEMVRPLNYWQTRAVVPLLAGLMSDGERAQFIAVV